EVGGRDVESAARLREMEIGVVREHALARALRGSQDRRRAARGTRVDPAAAASSVVAESPASFPGEGPGASSDDDPHAARHAIPYSQARMLRMPRSST